MYLALACLVAWALGQVALQLRTPSDLNLTTPILERLILIGLACPVVVLLRHLEDHSPWLLVTAAIAPWRARLGYLGGVYLAVFVLAGLLALTATRQPQLLVFADFLILFGIGAITSLLVGAHLAWTAPAGIALVCSTPGAIPLAFNPLARADAGAEVLACAVGLLLVHFMAFARFDDYGIGRRRLRSRQAGVTDE